MRKEAQEKAFDQFKLTCSSEVEQLTLEVEGLKSQNKLLLTENVVYIVDVKTKLGTYEDQVKRNEQRMAILAKEKKRI